MEYQNRTVGGWKIGIENSDVKKSGREREVGGLDILNYNNVATSMDGHCNFCTCHCIVHMQNLLWKSKSLYQIPHIVLFGFSNEDKKAKL